MTLVVAAVVWLFQSPDAETATAHAAEPTHSVAPGLVPGVDRLRQAFRARESDVWVEVGGDVERILPDDDEGSRHQKFILRVSREQTVLVAHNIDLARRVPLRRGDRVELRGEYEWNDRGGVLHWTHHDPRGNRDGGWIRHDGVLYR